MRALEQKDLPSYKIKQQKEGRECLWRCRKKNCELKYGRQLRRMVHGGRLPTTSQLRMLIKLQPILKPVNNSNQQADYLFILEIKKSIHLTPTEKPEPNRRQKMLVCMVITAFIVGEASKYGVGPSNNP